ncbi:MAG: hypothetical protein ACFB10_25985 [Salibacteraceae bacterium]
MKAFFATTVLALCCALFSFGQQTIYLANETACALNFQVMEVEQAAGGCSFYKRHNVIVAPYTAVPLTTAAPSGTEFLYGAASFVVNNCIAMSYAAPAGACATCTYPFLSSNSFTVNCNNNCQGSTFNMEWVDCASTGLGISYIVIWE